MTALNGFDCPAAFWILIGIQTLGLMSAWAARVSEGSSGQTASHLLFFACLALVGTATVVALAIGPGCWLTSATTLSLMVLMVTCDFSGTCLRNQLL